MVLEGAGTVLVRCWNGETRPSWKVIKQLIVNLLVGPFDLLGRAD